MRKKNVIYSVILLIVSIVYTLIVKYVDVKEIGPNGSSVGLSWLNGLFHKLIGNNMFIYKISEIFGYLLFILVLIFGCIGLYQLVKRKSLFKVDSEIIKLGCFYVLMLAVYVFFEKVVINYRPVLIDGVLEASYPSSHTILSLCIGLSSIIVGQRYYNKKYIKKINTITLIIVGIVLFGRILSGVHWISDIIGGILISLTLISLFRLAYYWDK